MLRMILPVGSLADFTISLAATAFEFEDLPPGTYAFGVNLTKRPGAPRAGPPVFLPGTPLAAEATVLELKPGDRKEIGLLRLRER